jgi:hypothetical protein
MIRNVGCADGAKIDRIEGTQAVCTVSWHHDPMATVIV